jgi:hypothetical protein
MLVHSGVWYRIFCDATKPSVAKAGFICKEECVWQAVRSSAAGRNFIVWLNFACSRHLGWNDWRLTYVNFQIGWEPQFVEAEHSNSHPTDLPPYISVGTFQTYLVRLPSNGQYPICYSGVSLLGDSGAPIKSH